MTERQHNTRLLNDKFSQLPVPPGDVLWSRIEAQLPDITGPSAQQPTQQPVQPSAVAKWGLLKTGAVIVSSIILVIFAIWLIQKINPSKKNTPAKQKPAVQQIQQRDTSKTNKPVTADNQLSPHPEPARKKEIPVSEIPMKPDHPRFNSAPVLQPLQKPDLPAVSIHDSTTASQPAALTQLPADSVQLKLRPPQKKDEGYYFDVKKKKG